MDPTFLAILLSVSTVSLVSLAGVSLLALTHEAFHALISFLVALAVGALFGDAFLHLLPEAFREGDPLRASSWALAGILGFLAIENFLHWRHQHSDEEREIEPYGYLSLLADAIHNFIDGLLIGASWLGGPALGMATTLAVVLHEVPQEFSDFAVLVRSGFTRGKALLLNFLTALTALAGGLLAWWVGSVSQGFIQALLPLAAGNFIYLAGSDLVPQMHRQAGSGRVVLRFLAVLLGVGLMALLKALE